MTHINCMKFTSHGCGYGFEVYYYCVCRVQVCVFYSVFWSSEDGLTYLLFVAAYSGGVEELQPGCVAANWRPSPSVPLWVDSGWLCFNSTHVGKMQEVTEVNLDFSVQMWADLSMLILQELCTPNLTAVSLHSMRLWGWRKGVEYGEPACPVIRMCTFILANLVGWCNDDFSKFDTNKG